MAVKRLTPMDKLVHESTKRRSLCTMIVLYTRTEANLIASGAAGSV
jgi:hypothetical protein